MPYETPVLNAAADGAVAIAGFAAVHDGATAGDQVSNERIAIGYDPAVGGIAASGDVPLAFTGTPGGPATHLGVWSLIAGGTFRGAVALVGDQTFNADGEYNVTAVTTTAVNG